VTKGDKDSAPLREGRADLETGVVGKTTGPELRARSLFRDRFVAVVRVGHPLCRGQITRSRYAAAEHIQVARREVVKGPVEDALETLGLERQIVTTVSSFSVALALARASDLIATVPERYTGALRAGMRTFALPFETPQITISMLWHPRMDADPAHGWLRERVQEVCARHVADGSPRHDTALQK
jgi:DNA-binding transcriptional LysR family regulator